MWVVALFTLTAACTFTHGALQSDGGAPDATDARPDVQIVPTWAVDPMSGKGVPASTAEWARLISAYNLTVAAPDHVWLMQEATGGLADSIGSASLAPIGTPSYQSAISGWSRKAVGTPEVNADEGFATMSSGNLDGTSYALLVYTAVEAAPIAEHPICGVGATTDYRYVAITPMPVYKAAGLGGVSPTTGTIDPGATVHPLLLEIDATHQAYVVYSDQERLVVSWQPTSGTGGLVDIGSAAFGAAKARYVYAAAWAGTHAELATMDVKSLFSSLGWVVSGW